MSPKKKVSKIDAPPELVAELISATQAWRDGINSNRDKWTIEHSHAIQKAGRRIFEVLDKIEATQKAKTHVERL